MTNNHQTVWTLTHTCKDTVTGYAVEISTAPARGNELQYSFRIGRLVKQQGTGQAPGPEKFIPHIRAHKDRSSMVHVGLETPFVTILTTLLEEAEEWITSDMAARHDEDIEARIVKETKQAGFGQKETKRTGKTERNRNKRKGAA